MNIRRQWSSLREYLAPVSHESNFKETGQISPEEFVLAGDYLVSKFPTWAWGSGPQHLQKKFLPGEKQFLVTKHVPSYRRYASLVPEFSDKDVMNGALGSSDLGEIDAEWIPTFVSKSAERAISITAASIGDLDELIEDYVEDALSGEDAEEYTHKFSGYSQFRKYDLYIAYSTSYRVPKVYLVGFDGSGVPLLPPQMYEDISGDYMNRTATIERLPMAQSTMSVSIHPCKHSSVMKVFMEHALAKSKMVEHTKISVLALQESSCTEFNEPANYEEITEAERGIRVDHYLIIFLKFIASVTPGIVYDFTMDAL